MRFTYSYRKMAKLLANNEDPDQTPRYAASDLGLHGLLFTLLQWVKSFFDALGEVVLGCAFPEALRIQFLIGLCISIDEITMMEQSNNTDCLTYSHNFAASLAIQNAHSEALIRQREWTG